MQIIPDRFIEIIKQDKTLNLAILDIDNKFENIIKNQSPVFFPQYTDHGIDHFINTLKMALHLIDLDDSEKRKGKVAVIDEFSALNSLILVSSILFHDLGMHIHFKGFKQLIDGFYDDVRIDFFDEYTWRQEWENFIIEAKRFSGRERINLFGDEHVIIKDIDFSKSTVDSDIQKNLIGEFIRRHHGRLAHEIILKGFPVQENEVIDFAQTLKIEYKDIIGVIARSHSMNVRDALEYIEEVHPADPFFPYEIEAPFLMCILRIADYFQFDKNRTNAIIVKLKSFTSPFSVKEHETHLSTEYFKTDEKDPETLFVNIQPKDGLIYTKIINLFDDIQKELDTSFAIIGEYYARHKENIKLRYRRIKTNLKNKKVTSRLPYMPDAYRFEADTDLFKLLVGPLYGYDASYGVRELLQNSIDACIELGHKSTEIYTPLIVIKIEKNIDKYSFTIEDNGKGMSIGEIKNYFLKAGASFRNSMEWKIDHLKEDNTPAIRRTGKFGIGVLASFLIGDTIEVTTKRFNGRMGYTFKADLKNEYIEIKKNENCTIGTTIVIDIDKQKYVDFSSNPEKLMQWYLLSYPKIKYYIDNEEILKDKNDEIILENDMQYLNDSVAINFKNFDNIIWSYKIPKTIAINGILIPNKYYQEKDFEQEMKPKTIYDEIDKFPFISILDKNNLIDLELNRNSIRGDLPFIKELVESCKLDFLYKLIFFKPPIDKNLLTINEFFTRDYYGNRSLKLNSPQYATFHRNLILSKNGYVLDNIFFNSVYKSLTHYHILFQRPQKNFNIIDNSFFSFSDYAGGVNADRNILRGEYKNYLAITTPDIYLQNFDTPKISKYIREKLSVIKKTREYIVFKSGDIKNGSVQELIELFKKNDAVAVHAFENSLSHNEDLSKLLKKHLGVPILIPIKYKAKLDYTRNCSKELQQHIIEKRGIKL